MTEPTPTERELRDERDRVEGRERKKRAGRFRNPTNGIGWCRDREPRQYDILGNAEPEVQFYFEGHGGCTFSTDVAELAHDDMTTLEVCQVLLAETSIWCRSGAVLEKVLKALKAAKT